MSLWEAFYGRRLRLVASMMATTATASALAAADFGSSSVNYSPGYLLPVIATAPMGRLRWLIAMTTAMVAITFLGYFLPISAPTANAEAIDDSFRLVNRGLIAMVIIATACLLGYVYPQTAAGPSRGRTFPTIRPLPQIKNWFGNNAFTVVAVFCLVCELTITIVDCLAPATYNIALLHLFPVAVSALGGTRLLLWGTVLAALIGTRLGVEHGPDIESEVFQSPILLNRFMVRLTIIGVAILLEPWASRRKDDANGLDLDIPGPHLAWAAPSRQIATPSRQRNAPKVLYLDHAARLGGGEIALLNLLKVLDKQRFRPSVVLAEDGPLVDKLKGEGIPTEVIPLSRRVLDTRKDTLDGRALLRIGEIWTSVAYAGKLAMYIRRGRFSIIHTNSLKADVIGGLAARLSGCHVVWHVRDRIDPDYLPAPAVHTFRAVCCALADYVVTNSHACMGLLRPTFGDIFGERAARERMRVVHDGVPSEAFIPTNGHRTNRSPVVGLVGRISPFKGQEYFIEAAAIVRRQFPDVKFRIIGSALFGESDYEAGIRKQVVDLNLEGTVEFAGFRSDVQAAIAELDVVAHASVTGEPFGLVIAEGMAAGKPVVATGEGGVPEIIEDGVSGLLVPVRDSKALADAILRYLSDPQTASEIAARGRERIAKFFTIDNSARKAEAFYDYILARRRGARPAAAKSEIPSWSAFALHWGLLAGALCELMYSVFEIIRIQAT